MLPIEQLNRSQNAGTQPAVTIITPTKNRLALLREAINSVRIQTFQNWEHIVVDDGSDDGTADELHRYSQHNSRVRFIRRKSESGGANVCRNIGVRESAADLIVFLDSDDLLRPLCLEQRVQVMGRNLDIDFAIFMNAVFENNPGDLGDRVSNDQLGDDLTRFLSFECPWVITGPIWRRDALLKIGCFDESLLCWQDIDLHIRAIACGLKYLRLSEIDHDIRWQFENTKVSVKQQRSLQYLEAAPSIFLKFEKAVRNGPGMNWNRQRALCGLYFQTAERMLEIGCAARARVCWKKVRERRLADQLLYAQGAILLGLMSLGGLGFRMGVRLAHKWKGIVRFRTLPELAG